MSPRESHHRIEIRLRELKQLFNSMDPAPFLDQDLDPDAEQFIVESAEEFPGSAPLELVVHLQSRPEEPDPHHVLLTGIHHYFHGRAEQTRNAFRRLMRQGQTSLLIGLIFLTACFTAAEFVKSHSGENQLLGILGEGLVIAGWVAMWRPMEIYLYDWWPIRRKLRLYRRLSRMPVKVLLPKEASPS